MRGLRDRFLQNPGRDSSPRGAGHVVAATCRGDAMVIRRQIVDTGDDVMSGRGRAVSKEDRRAEELHGRAIVIDAACPLVNPRQIAAYVPALQRGGVTCAFSTVASIEPARYAVGALSAWYARAREFAGAISLAHVCRKVGFLAPEGEGAPRAKP